MLYVIYIVKNISRIKPHDLPKITNTFFLFRSFANVIVFANFYLQSKVQITQQHNKQYCQKNNLNNKNCSKFASNTAKLSY